MENPFIVTPRINLIEITFSNPNGFEFNWNTWLLFCFHVNYLCILVHLRGTQTGPKC